MSRELIISYWVFDVAAIKGEDEWSVLNGN